MPSLSNEVQLSCGCRRIYNPQPVVGELLYCCRHPQSECRVTAVMDAVWKARCQAQCRYSRTFGQDETTASRAASAHVAKHPGHVVELSRGADLIMTVGVAQGMLPGLTADTGMPF